MRLVLLFLLSICGALPTSASGAQIITESGNYSQGEYILWSDIKVESGHGLVFEGPATLDLNGHSIETEAAGDDWDIGVAMFGENSLLFDSKGGGRITGFRVGGKFSGDRTQAIGVEFSNNRYIGIWVEGRDVHILGGMVSETSGISDEPYAFGVQVNGDNCIIENLVVKNIYVQEHYRGDADGEGVGINLASPSTGGRVKNNLIINEKASIGGYGVFGGSGGDHEVRNSTIRNFWRGISVSGEKGSRVVNNRVVTSNSFAGGYGISAGRGVIADNHVNGYASPLDGAPQGSNRLD